MNDVLYKCGYCNNFYSAKDMCIRRWDGKYADLNMCLYCSHERYFFSIAQYRIRTLYKMYSGECPPDLIEIEMVAAKIRYVLMGKDPQYIKFKKTNMITQVNNSSEMRQALNENLHALLTKKRKLLVVKEVNNTLGKILLDVRMELMQNALTGSKESISWFYNHKEIGEAYGVVPRLKYVNQQTLTT